MNWVYAMLVTAALLACWRVYIKIKTAATQRADDWDEQLVKNWRAQGGNGFAPTDVDFFFGVPDSAHCELLANALQADACVVDFRPATTEGATGYTMHAAKAIRISVSEMQEHSARYRRLAAQHESRYDGWATKGVTRNVESNLRLRPRGVPPSGYANDLSKLK
jgi:Regulator of ribonuclease activity B